jgi:hypothetical protein
MQLASSGQAPREPADLIPVPLDGLPGEEAAPLEIGRRALVVAAGGEARVDFRALEVGARPV